MFFYWFFAITITIGAAYYQRKSGPTYPKRFEVNVNNIRYKLKLVRSLSLDERPEVKLAVTDTTVKAKLYFRRFPSKDIYQVIDFTYNASVGHQGFFADVPKQTAAGKIQYYFEITDSSGTKTFFKDQPVVIRFKGRVPVFILFPHVLLMFIAMLFSTLAGLLSLGKHPLSIKFADWTLILLISGGIIMGPVVQYYAFGEFWTGIPFGWDLTDNKTLIASLFWILAVVMNRKKVRLLYIAIASLVLLLVYSIPHSMFGSELNYESGEVTRGMINFFLN